MEIVGSTEERRIVNLNALGSRNVRFNSQCAQRGELRGYPWRELIPQVLVTDLVDLSAQLRLLSSRPAVKKWLDAGRTIAK